MHINFFVLDITQEDIDKGECLSASACPLARAALRAGLVAPQVAGGVVTHRFWGRYRHSTLPRKAWKWAMDYDTYHNTPLAIRFQRPPEPAAFVLGLKLS